RSALFAKWKSRNGQSEQEMHRRISRWFEQQKLFEEAIDHALKAEEWNRALDIMEPMARTMFMQRLHHTEEQWLRQIPEDSLKTRPEMCLWYAYALIQDRQFARAEGPMAIAEEATEPRWLRSAVWSGRAIAAFIKGQDNVVSLAQKALKAPG